MPDTYQITISYINSLICMYIYMYTYNSVGSRKALCVAPLTALQLCKARVAGFQLPHLPLALDPRMSRITLRIIHTYIVGVISLIATNKMTLYLKETLT